MSRLEDVLRAPRFVRVGPIAHLAALRRGAGKTAPSVCGTTNRGTVVPRREVEERLLPCPLCFPTGELPV